MPQWRLKSHLGLYYGKKLVDEIIEISLESLYGSVKVSPFQIT